MNAATWSAVIRFCVWPPVGAETYPDPASSGRPVAVAVSGQPSRRRLAPGAPRGLTTLYVVPAAAR